MVSRLRDFGIKQYRVWDPGPITLTPLSFISLFSKTGILVLLNHS